MKSPLARNTILVLLIQGIGLGLSFILQLILARAMGVEQYGIYSFVISMASLLAIASGLGLPEGSLRFIPEYLGRQDWPRLFGYIRSSRRLVLLAGMLVGLSGSMLFLVLGLKDLELYLLPILLGLILVPLASQQNLHTSFFRGLNRGALAYALPLMGRPGLILAGSLFLVLDSRAVGSVEGLLVTLAGFLLITSLQFTLFNRQFPHEVRKVSPVNEIRSWLRISFPLLLVASFDLALHRSNVVLVGILLSPREVGYYNAAVRTAGVIYTTMIAALAIGAPRIALLHSQGRRTELQATVSFVVKWSFWPSLVVAGGMLAFSSELMGFFGPEFVAGQPALVILLVGQLFNIGAGPLITIANLTGNQDLSARAMGIALGGGVVASLIGALLWGTVGAATAVSLTLVGLKLWMHPQITRRVGIQGSILSTMRSGPTRSS